MADAPAERTLELSTLGDTERLANRVAATAPSGSVLVLSGPLGAGKTTFTRFLAQALGSTAAVSSPTYSLVHEYPTPSGLLVHIDAYRLESVSDLVTLGLDDYTDRARLVVVEWGEVLLDERPDALWLELSFDTDAYEDLGGGEPADQSPRLARWRRSPPAEWITTRGEGGVQ